MTLNRFYRFFSRTDLPDEFFGNQPSEPHHLHLAAHRHLAEEERLPGALHAADDCVHFSLHRPRLLVLLRSKGPFHTEWDHHRGGSYCERLLSHHRAPAVPIA